jgi:hypothetical protein
LYGGVDTGVKKKLLMGQTVYAKAGPDRALKPLVTIFETQESQRRRHGDSPDFWSFYQWTLIPNSIDRGEPPPPSRPNVVGLERLRLGPPDWK